MKSLKEIFQRIELRKKRLKQGLEKIINQLKEIGALKIIVFGSFVKDQIGPSSDLDILVIMPTIKSGRDWLREIYQRIERYVASDIIVFNLREYEDSKNENFLLKEIERRGKVLYEKRT
jgi:predicted nucleotidyltransferase